MGFIFKVISFLGGWIALAVLALSVSAGLYLACEIAEEYSSTVRRYLHKSTLGIGFTYIILAIDGLPFTKCALGLLTYFSYLPLLATFPFVQPVSLVTIWALIVTLANHISWFNYFLSHDYREELRSSYDESSFISGGNPAMRVMGFLFIFVWLVPLGFFISLTSIDESLPLAQQGHYGQSKKNKGIFKTFVDGLWEKRSLFSSGGGTQKRYE
mmetsp:Transcript_8861/g.16734  ORF Transcript_8861/g.16734 Transcript_8861/m.16734 type:complete len:213 (+) Transcript_8861:139-777(+)